MQALREFRLNVLAAAPTTAAAVLLLAPALFFTLIFHVLPLLFTFSITIWTRNPVFVFPDNYRDFLGDFSAAAVLLSCLIGAAAGAWGLFRDNAASPSSRALWFGVGLVLLPAIGTFGWLDATSGLPTSAAAGASLLVGAAAIPFIARQHEPWSGWRLRLFGVLSISGAVIVAGTATGRMRQAVREFSFSTTQDVLQTFYNTFLFATLSVALQIALALVMAYALHRPLPGRPLFRLAIILPYLAPAVAMAVVFQAIFSPSDAGLANQLLRAAGLPISRWAHEEFLVLEALGLPHELASFGPTTSLITLVAFNVWCFAGYTTALLLAGMASIPRAVYEAAELDGATSWAAFRDITVPLLSPVLLFAAITGWIGSAQSFNHTYILLEAAENPRLFTAPVEIYRSRRELEAASAIAVVLFVIIALVTVLQLILLRKRVHYGE